ncbi:hypothetical protein AMS68_003304 [Peltaster fructicola]|uniref:Uncharacterized protein n=1 Tax=Peltaster fructicola TaxID=286661 RepID=A0A6H0XSP7_9PEZI|nr:hypothetical protein AMS68_003304 [Peltaster fructicola]
MAQTQAFDILLQALPSAAASSLAKQLSSPHSSTLSFFTSQTTSQTTFSTVVSQSTLTSSADPSTSVSQSTTTNLATASAASMAAQTTGAASTAALSNPGLSPGAIAGIAFGSVAAVLLMLFVLLFFVRSRRERGHQRSGSQTSLLGSITGGAAKKKKKTFPEVAWLYDPVRSAPQSATIHSNRNSRPQMGANAPWNSRPSTTAEYERTLTALPSASVAEMSALPGTPGFLRTADLTRQPSYPLRTTFPAENVTQETMSPLLPPLPRTAVREGRESLGHHAITTDENVHLRAREPAWTGAFRGTAVRPSMDGRPQTRHGMPPVHRPGPGAF